MARYSGTIVEYWSGPSLLLDSNNRFISNSAIAAAIAQPK